MTSKDEIMITNNKTLVILPKKSLTFLDNIIDIWEHWGVAWSLALRDIQVRYKQSVIGIFWTVLQPLITTLVFTLIFSIAIKMPADNTPYPIFVLSGLLFWQYFSKVVVEASDSLVKNEVIITKVFFPRIVLPLAPTLSGAVDMAISFCMLILLMLFYGVIPTSSILLLPILLLVTGLLGYGVGLILSPINAIYRDISIALPFFVQIAMYLTPVIYPVNFLPQDYQWLFMFNPVATLLETARYLILGGNYPLPTWQAFGIFFSWLSIIFTIGFYSFRKLEPSIVDRI